MARYGTIHDGINDYQFSTDSNLDLSATSSWAFCFFVKLDTKATSFHYLLSTGSFDLNNLNFYFSSSTNTLGYNATGVSYSTTATFADIFTTEYFVGIMQDGGDFKVMTCPVGSTAAVETIATGQSATSKTGKTWQWMRRGDANADRYAKGTFSNPIRLSAPPTLAQFEAVANGGDPITEFGANLVVNWDFSTGTGASSTDTEVSAVITQSGMPTDDSQWTLIVGGGGNTSNIAVTVPAPTFASTASSTVPTFDADIAYSVSAPTFAATSTVTAPGSGATVAFSVSKPTFAATASNAVPAYSSDVAFALSAPVFASTATATAPSKTADVAVTIGAPIFAATADRVNPAAAAVSFTIGKPVFAAAADNTAPQFDADIAFTINAPTFSATASRVNPGNQADVDLTLSAPTFAATGTNTIPEFSADAAYTIPAPVFSILAGTDADVYYYPKGTQVIISTGSRIVTIVSQSRIVRI